jgi:trehalose synthase-fused probable maltokinase
MVFGDELVLKSFRRLGPGVNPELELLRFLTERGFENIAQLGGWYAYTGKQMDATLGILQRFVAHAEDGWERALDAIVAGDEAFLDTLRRLGEVTGRMHSALGSDSTEPSFCPEQTSSESLGLLTATVDEEIERVFLELPEDNEQLAPIVGRGEEVREQLRLLTHAGSVGKVIRTHGDYHLGQTMRAERGWVILDFEGEPARPLAERRGLESPVKDVAGMLRSFDYAAASSTHPDADAWARRAGDAYLAGYEHAGGAIGDHALLTAFELDKAVYEASYEARNRPSWLSIPVRAIERLSSRTPLAG